MFALGEILALLTVAAMLAALAFATNRNYAMSEYQEMLDTLESLMPNETATVLLSIPRGETVQIWIVEDVHIEREALYVRYRVIEDDTTPNCTAELQLCLVPFVKAEYGILAVTPSWTPEVHDAE